MKTSNEQKLGDAIREMLHELRLDQKLNEVQLVNSWESIVGKMIANHTKELYVRKKKLVIELDLSALKHELILSKSKLLKRLNEAFGKEVVTDIVFI